MTLTIGEILGLQTFYNKIKDKPLSIKVAFAFTKLFNKVQEELKFYQEHLIQLSEKYGERDADGNLVYLEDGQSVKISTDKAAECQQDLNDLAALEVELEPINLDLDALGDIALTIEEMQTLIKIIKE